MNAMIREFVKVDADHTIHLVDPRLQPGQIVQIIVSAAPAANTPTPSLLELASQYPIDAPADYSTNFEQVLR
jgi:hypothetical protein